MTFLITKSTSFFPLSLKGHCAGNKNELRLFTLGEKPYCVSLKVIANYRVPPLACKPCLISKHIPQRILMQIFSTEIEVLEFESEPKVYLSILKIVSFGHVIMPFTFCIYFKSQLSSFSSQFFLILIFHFLFRI